MGIFNIGLKDRNKKKGGALSSRLHPDTSETNPETIRIRNHCTLQRQLLSQKKSPPSLSVEGRESCQTSP